MTAIIVIIAVLLVILFSAASPSGGMGPQENPPPSPPRGPILSPRRENEPGFRERYLHRNDARRERHRRNQWPL